MKRTTVTAIIIAVLLIGALALFTLYRKPTPSTPLFSIVGAWQLDTVYTSPTVSQRTIELTTALNEAKETEKLTYEFTADSIFKTKSLKDDRSQKYYLQDSLLHIEEDSSFRSYPFTRVSDSLVRFSDADSVVFVLKRK